MNQCHHGGLDPVCAIRDVLSSGQNPMLKTGDAATHMIVLWLSSEALRVWKVVLLESESGERLCALIVLHAELRSSREASPSGRCGAVGGRWRVRSWRYSLNVSCHRKTLLFLMFFFSCSVGSELVLWKSEEGARLFRDYPALWGAADFMGSAFKRFCMQFCCCCCADDEDDDDEKQPLVT